MRKKLNLLLSRLLDNYLQEYLKKNLPVQYSIYGDENKLKIAKTAVVNNALFNLSCGEIVIEDYSFFGHNVTVLTGTHDYCKLDRERQITTSTSELNIMIKRGAWIASNAIIIAPCVVGEHAVVCAGSVVTKDVPPYTMVAGIPAKIIKEIVHSK